MRASPLFVRGFHAQVFAGRNARLERSKFSGRRLLVMEPVMVLFGMCWRLTA